MTIALRSFVPTLFLRRTAALAAITCAPAFALHAQTVTSPVTAAPLFSLHAAAPMDFLKVAGIKEDDSSSSSSSSTADAIVDERASLAPADALQPPPRRRYGRPRYNDSSHNPDGSPKYAFMAGAGLTLPTGNTYHYLNTDYSFQVGAGRNFNKNAALFLQFDWDNFGFNGRTLAQQAFYYQAQGQGLDGKSHLWSITLDPTYNIYASEGLGAYVVGGVGFYHKTANFTVPTTGIYFDPYYGPIQYTANQTIDDYTSNAVGVNGGFGLTYKPSRFSSQRLYVEARYVFVDNQNRPGITGANYQTYQGNNYYPANSHRTTYVPIKAGIRF